MSQSLRRLLAGSAAVAAVLTALIPTASAAPPDRDPDAGQPTAVVATPPGKGDTDGDKIADDLEAAVAGLQPGDRVAVIVQGATPGEARRAAPSLTLDHEYTIIPAFAGSVTAGQVTALAHIPWVTRVELDGVARATDASGDRDYGVEAARASFPVDGALDGSGVGVCIIDTGLDPAHEQFSAARVKAWNDWVHGRTAPYDDHGHGTHVAGIAAGDALGTAAAATAGGVARAADLYIAKVLDSSGSGSDSDVAAAIEWCAGLPGVRVISMSLGSPGGDGSDAGSQAANAAVAAGKVVVVAAGNEGDAPGTIASPGVATSVVTVGAASDPSALAGNGDTDAGLYLASFSSRGPTTNPAAALKPDVVAPGLSVVAAKANTASSYITYSGTSMATPFVAGVVALGLEAVPAAAPAAVKSALQTTAVDAGAPGADNEWGYGLVDAHAFVTALGATGSGSATVWPAHALLAGSVGSGATVDFPFVVGTAGQPLGVSLQTTNGAATCLLPVGGSCWYGYEWAPDLDAYLISPAGVQVAMSRCMLESSNGNCAAPGRFETLGIASAAAGTWKLRVQSFSGSGSFRADVFSGIGGGTTPPPTPPAAPAALTASAVSSSQVNLGWTDASNDESGFRIERCAGAACTDFAQIAAVGSNATTYANTGLTAGTTYSYRVLAFNGGLVSEYSNTATTTTPAAATPAAPSSLVASAVSRSQINLTWNDNASTETGFRIQRCTGTTCTNFVQIANVGANVTAYANTGLKANTTYRYRLLAYNAAGTSVYSNIAAASTPRR